MDLASIVVSLMPQQSKARFPASIANDAADAIHKTARVLDTYCREKHLPHVQDEANHVCQVEMLVIPKTPVLTMPLHLLQNISEENGREQLERNSAGYSRFTQGINRYHNCVRTIKLRDFITINENEDYLGHFRTHAGDLGNESNCHALEFFAPGPRSQLINQLVNLGCRKRRNVEPPRKYQSFLETGSDKQTPRDETQRDRTIRAIGAGRQNREDSRNEHGSSSRHESHSRHNTSSSSNANSHHRREDRRDRDRSGHRNRSRSRDPADLRHQLSSPNRGGRSSSGHGGRGGRR